MSKINRWGSRNCVMTSSEVCAIRTRCHFSRWPPSTFRALCSAGWISWFKTTGVGVKQSNQDISRSVRGSRGQNSKSQNKVVTVMVLEAQI